jgi:Nif11 domain
MSLEHVDAFYDLVSSDQVIYDQYYNQCCRLGFLGSYHWDKSKIVDFAANLGYSFSENDLDQVWFGNEPSFSAQSLNLSEYEHMS